MSDRYLLESGAPDGYLLEDGTGVLILEQQTNPLDENSDSWWAGQMSDVPRARVAAALAISVAVASAIAPSDEIIPYQGSDASRASVTGQRAQFGINFVRWHQNDEPPVTAAVTIVDDDPAIPARIILPVPDGIMWATADDGIIASGAEEDYEWKPQSLRPVVCFATVYAQDELSSNQVVTIVEDEPGPVSVVLKLQPRVLVVVEDDFPAVTIVEESYWVQIQAHIEPVRAYTITLADEVFAVIATEEGESVPPPSVLVSPQAYSLVGSDQEIVPQPVPLQVEDEYWLQQALYVAPVVPTVFVPGGDEEMGDFVPPPVVETLDLGAKWPLKFRQYLTKIKDRFYWFTDESELPKEKAPSSVLKVAQKPVIEPVLAAAVSDKIAEEKARLEKIKRTNEAIMQLFM